MHISFSHLGGNFILSPSVSRLCVCVQVMCKSGEVLKATDAKHIQQCGRGSLSQTRSKRGNQSE